MVHRVLSEGCNSASWWGSLDTPSRWSVCPRNNTYLRGFWRSPHKTGDERVGRLEEGRCCDAAEPRYAGQPSRCVNANWSRTLNGFNVWALCPKGFYMNGIRTGSTHPLQSFLNNIEEARCCHPTDHPSRYEDCYDEDVAISFNTKGWSECQKNGYYMTGFYKSNCHELNCIDKFKCCKHLLRTSDAENGQSIPITDLQRELKVDFAQYGATILVPGSAISDTIETRMSTIAYRTLKNVLRLPVDGPSNNQSAGSRLRRSGTSIVSFTIHDRVSGSLNKPIKLAFNHNNKLEKQKDQRFILHSQELCTTAAVLLHYSLLSVFFWMLCHGVMLYFLILKAERQEILALKQKWFYALGWVKRFIGVEKILGIKGTINSILLIFLLRRVLRATKTKNNKTPAKHVKDWLRRFAMLLPVLGVTWSFGFLTFITSTAVFHYIFTILNSFQGLFIFVSFCILDDSVKKSIESILCEKMNTTKRDTREGNTVFRSK
ncbi:hypothetical protein pdam_00013401 [Pocillopora damicornis]|uniref:G-protein coupled receptors family 2 profile 2 domain-containing protein n=1 Tax=Pocillopora damicornis TaxID=46731 RepID=A0A3M6UWM4_POCDA|nr:hypothetical protein pdam_00013401 [Pocillopora damicornis]